MTYRELAMKILGEFTEEQLQMDVTVLDEQWDEFYPAHLEIARDNGVLDENHPYINLAR